MTAWTMWEFPFFEPAHSEIGALAAKFTTDLAEPDSADLEPACRSIASSLGEAGLLNLVVPEGSEGKLDLRSICLVREILAYKSALIDSVFAMQGIGSAAILQHGSADQKNRYLDGIRSGARIAAFALTETRTGSDVGGMETTAHREPDGSFVLTGEKTLISNAPFADHYIVVARTGEGPGTRGLSAFIVDTDTPGLVCDAPIELIAPHPIGSLRFEDCRIEESSLVGAPGEGFRVAMSTFNVYRTSVGAAALGMARRARDLSLDRVTTRELFGAPLSELDSVRSKVADMEIALTTAALSVYSAAWFKDRDMGPGTREASIAKYVGTEHGWDVIDTALQLFGGHGLKRGAEIERIFREARAMRIYEGASEVQRHIIGREVIRGMAEPS